MGKFLWLFCICLLQPHHHDLYPWSSHGEQADSCMWYLLSYQETAAVCLHFNMVHLCVWAPSNDREWGARDHVSFSVLGSFGKCRCSLFTGTGVHYTMLLGWTDARQCCVFWETILGRKKPHQGPLNHPCIFILNFFFLLTCSCLRWTHTMPLGFPKLRVVLNNISVVKYAAVLKALKLQDACS